MGRFSIFLAEVVVGGGGGGEEPVSWNASSESFRFWDEDDCEYEIFPILSSARAWTSVILAGKCDSSRHSTTTISENVPVAGTSYQILEV